MSKKITTEDAMKEESTESIESFIMQAMQGYFDNEGIAETAMNTSVRAQETLARLVQCLADNERITAAQVHYIGKGYSGRDSRYEA